MKTFVVAGLGFGDEGKGTMVDWLVREHGIKYVCRYNGAFQAAHNVITPKGVHHTFSQFGSGTLAADDVKTLLFGHMIINPYSFLKERKTLRRKGINTDGRVMVSKDCRVNTVFHAILNKTYETCRGGSRHGSCGRGVGLTANDENPIFAKDLADRKVILPKLRHLKEKTINDIILHQYGRKGYVDYLNERIDEVRHTSIEEIAEAYYKFCGKVDIVDEQVLLDIVKDNPAVFEGAQGVLLDEKYGFFPHVTKSNATFENALGILSKAGFGGGIDRVGVLRAYHTRHGHGPFPTGSEEMDTIEEDHNGTGEFQGVFRNGYFDAVLAKYALDVVGGVDTLALTCIDKLYSRGMNYIVDSYKFHLDGRMFVGRGYIDSLSVCENMTSGEHATRNEALERCTIYGTYLDQVEEGNLESVAEFVMGLSDFIGKKIDIVSLSPTCEGKMYVNEDELAKAKEMVNG